MGGASIWRDPESPAAAGRRGPAQADYPKTCLRWKLSGKLRRDDLRHGSAHHLGFLGAIFALEGSLGLNPDEVPLFDEQKPRIGQMQQAGSLVIGVHRDSEQPVPFERLDRPAYRRTIHHGQGGKPTDTDAGASVDQAQNTILVRSQAQMRDAHIEISRHVARCVTDRREITNHFTRRRPGPAQNLDS